MQTANHKNQKTWAQINTDALIHNFGVLSEKIRESRADTRIMCVVKADAYGHSAPLCIPALCRAGARDFAVSNIDEATDAANLIKSSGHSFDCLLILGYTPEDDDNVLTLVKEKITQAVYSYDCALKFESALERLCENKKISPSEKLSVHIKLDTGMNRLGFDTHDDAFAESAKQIYEISKLAHIKIDGIFSHFACADEKDAEMSEEQNRRFEQTVNAAEKLGVNFAVKHICNSAGALSYPPLYKDMVRLGIVLYGLSPSDEVQGENLRPVMTFYSTLAHIHTLRRGDTISYGATFTAQRDMKVATLGVGYADGFMRSFSRGGGVIINRKFAPIVGRVCMDQCMVDISDIDCKCGDVAVIFDETGENTRALARAADTITYELVCLLSKRVVRTETKN